MGFVTRSLFGIGKNIPFQIDLSLICVPWKDFVSGTVLEVCRRELDIKMFQWRIMALGLSLNRQGQTGAKLRSHNIVKAFLSQLTFFLFFGLSVSRGSSGVSWVRPRRSFHCFVLPLSLSPIHCVSSPAAPPFPFATTTSRGVWRRGD